MSAQMAHHPVSCADYVSSPAPKGWLRAHKQRPNQKLSATSSWHVIQAIRFCPLIHSLTEARHARPLQTCCTIPCFSVGSLPSPGPLNLGHAWVPTTGPGPSSASRNLMPHICSGSLPLYPAPLVQAAHSYFFLTLLPDYVRGLLVLSWSRLAPPRARLRALTKVGKSDDAWTYPSIFGRREAPCPEEAPFPSGCRPSSLTGGSGPRLCAGVSGTPCPSQQPCGLTPHRFFVSVPS